MAIKKCKNCHEQFNDESTNSNELYCEECRIPKAAHNPLLHKYWYHLAKLTKDELKVLYKLKKSNCKYAKTTKELTQQKRQMKLILEAYKRMCTNENPKEIES